MKITSRANVARRVKAKEHTEGDERVGIALNGQSLRLFTIGDFTERRWTVELNASDVARIMAMVGRMDADDPFLKEVVWLQRHALRLHS